MRSIKPFRPYTIPLVILSFHASSVRPRSPILSIAVFSCKHRRRLAYHFGQPHVATLPYRFYPASTHSLSIRSPSRLHYTYHMPLPKDFVPFTTRIRTPFLDQPLALLYQHSSASPSPRINSRPKHRAPVMHGSQIIALIISPFLLRGTNPL